MCNKLAWEETEVVRQEHIHGQYTHLVKQQGVSNNEIVVRQSKVKSFEGPT